MSYALFDHQQWDFALQRYDRAKDILRDIMLEEIQEKINDHERHFERIAIIAKNAHSWVSEFGMDAEAVEINDTISFQQSDYDLILHLGALHRVNDPIGQMVQSRLALAPDGVFMASFLGGETLQELRHAFLVAESNIYGGASPHVAPMIEIKDAGNLLSRAGLAMPIADNIKQRWQYANMQNLLHDLRQLGLSNPLIERRKNFSKRALFDALNKAYIADFTCENGKIYASYELIFLTGYAPSKDQPKPLRPGSISKAFGENMEN